MLFNIIFAFTLCFVFQTQILQEIMSGYGQKKLNPLKNFTFEFVKSRCTTKISNATRDCSSGENQQCEKLFLISSENRIYAFLQLTPLISTRLDSEIGKIPSPVLQLLFGTIKSIIKNHKRIGNIDNRENLTLHKFLRKFCSFATIAGRVFNWPQCILFLSHLFPIDKTKFVAGRDKYALIQRIPRTTKSYSTYKDLRQIKGQEIHFQLLDKFLKYNGSTFLQSTLKFLTNGQIQGYPAFEMMMSLMRIYYSYFIYTEPRYCPIKEVSQIQTLIVYLPKIYQFPPMGKEERIDKLIRMIEFCGNQANASDNSMEKFLLKISIILLEDGLYQRVQLQNPQAINIVDPNSQQVQQSNSHTLMMKGVHFLNLLAKCSVGIKGQRGQSILDKPKEITLDDITSISNEIYKPSNGNEGIIKLCISLMNFGGQLLCDNLQVKQAGGQENKIQMEMLELAEVQRIYANAFIIPDQLLQDLFTFWEKIPLVQDGAENDPDKIIPKNFFHKAINNSKLELIIPTLTYLERKYWIEPTTQSQGQSSSTLVQLHQVAQCRIATIIVDPSDFQLLNNLFSSCKQQESDIVKQQQLNRNNTKDNQQNLLIITSTLNRIKDLFISFLTQIPPHSLNTQSPNPLIIPDIRPIRIILPDNLMKKIDKYIKELFQRDVQVKSDQITQIFQFLFKELNILFDEQQKKTEIAIQQQQSQLGSQRQFRGEKFIAIFCSLLMKADEIFTKICELKQQPAHQAFSFYSIGKCFRLNPHKDNDNANWDSEGGIDLLINNILSSIEGTIIKVEQQRQQGGNIREDNSEQEQNVIIDGMEVKGHLNCSSNALQTLMKMRSFEVDAAIEELNKKKIDKDIIPHFESLLQRHKLENVLQLINRLLSVLVERSQGLTGPGKSANIFINLVFENIYRTSFQIIQIQQKLIEKQGQLKLESLNNEDLKTKIVVIFFSYLNRILNPPFNSPYQLMTRFLDFINMFIGMRKIFKSSNLDIENDIDVIGLDSLFQLALNWPIGGQETIQTLERMQIREKYEIGKDVEKVLEQEYQIQTGIWNPALNFLVELGKISEQTKPDVNAHQQNRNNEYYLPNQIIIGECIKRLEDIFRDSNQQQQQSQPASIENKFLIIRLLLLYIQILREKRASILIDPFELVKIPLEGQEGQNLNNNNKNNPPTFMNNYNKPLPSLMIFGTIPPNYRDIRISEEDDIQTLRLRIARDQQVGDYTRVRVNFNNKDITYSRERVLSLTGRINLQDLKFEIGPQTYWNTNGPPKTIIPADPLSNHKQFYSKSNLQDDIKDYENALDVIKSKATMFSNIMNTHPQTKKMIECLLSIARVNLKLIAVENFINLSNFGTNWGQIVNGKEQSKEEFQQYIQYVFKLINDNLKATESDDIELNMKKTSQQQNKFTNQDIENKMKQILQGTNQQQQVETFFQQDTGQVEDKKNSISPSWRLRFILSGGLSSIISLFIQTPFGDLSSQQDIQIQQRSSYASQSSSQSQLPPISPNPVPKLSLDNLFHLANIIFNFLTGHSIAFFIDSLTKRIDTNEDKRNEVQQPQIIPGIKQPQMTFSIIYYALRLCPVKVSSQTLNTNSYDISKSGLLGKTQSQVLAFLNRLVQLLIYSSYKLTTETPLSVCSIQFNPLDSNGQSQQIQQPIRNQNQPPQPPPNPPISPSLISSHESTNYISVLPQDTKSNSFISTIISKTPDNDFIKLFRDNDQFKRIALQVTQKFEDKIKTNNQLLPPQYSPNQISSLTDAIKLIQEKQITRKNIGTGIRNQKNQEQQLQQQYHLKLETKLELICICTSILSDLVSFYPEFIIPIISTPSFDPFLFLVIASLAKGIEMCKKKNNEQGNDNGGIIINQLDKYNNFIYHSSESLCEQLCFSFIKKKQQNNPPRTTGSSYLSSPQQIIYDDQTIKQISSALIDQIQIAFTTQIKRKLNRNKIKKDIPAQLIQSQPFITLNEAKFIFDFIERIFKNRQIQLKGINQNQIMNQRINQKSPLDLNSLLNLISSQIPPQSQDINPLRLPFVLALLIKNENTLPEREIDLTSQVGQLIPIPQQQTSSLLPYYSLWLKQSLQLINEIDQNLSIEIRNVIGIGEIGLMKYINSKFLYPIESINSQIAIPSQRSERINLQQASFADQIQLSTSISNVTREILFKLTLSLIGNFSDPNQTVISNPQNQILNELVDYATRSQEIEDQRDFSEEITTLSQLNKNQTSSFFDYSPKYQPKEINQQISDQLNNLDLEIKKFKNKQQTQSPYSGIHNPKFMCYIISALQQLFMHRQFRDSMLTWDGRNWGEKKPQTTTDIQPSIRPQRPTNTPNGQRIILPEEKLEVEQFTRSKQDALRNVDLRITNQETFEELKNLFIELQNGQNANGISGQDKQVPTLARFLDKYRDITGMRINEDEQQDVNLFLMNLFDHLEIHLDCLEMHNFIRRYFRCFQSEQQICVNGHLVNNAQRSKIITVQKSGVSNLYEALGGMIRGVHAKDAICSECQEKRLGNNPLIKRTLLQTLPNTVIFNIARVDYDVKQGRAVKDKSKFTFPYGLNQKNRDGQRGGYLNEEDQLDDILDLTPFTREAVLKNEASVNSNQERYQSIKSKIDNYRKDKENESDIRSYSIKATSYDNMGRGEQYYKFRLVGVVVHQGNATGGHYYSYIRERNPPYRWIKFNDNKTHYVIFRNEESEQEKQKERDKQKEKEKEREKQKEKQQQMERIDKNIILVDSESEEDGTSVNNQKQLNDQNETESDYEESDIYNEDQIGYGSSSSSNQDQDFKGSIPIFNNQYDLMEEEFFGGDNPYNNFDAGLLGGQQYNQEFRREMMERQNSASLIIYERIQPIDDWAFELGLIPQNNQQQQTPQVQYTRIQQGVFNFSNLNEINLQQDPVIEKAQKQIQENQGKNQEQIQIEEKYQGKISLLAHSQYIFKPFYFNFIGKLALILKNLPVEEQNQIQLRNRSNNPFINISLTWSKYLFNTFAHCISNDQKKINYFTKQMNELQELLKFNPILSFEFIKFINAQLIGDEEEELQRVNKVNNKGSQQSCCKSIARQFIFHSPYEIIYDQFALTIQSAFLSIISPSSSVESGQSGGRISTLQQYQLPQNQIIDINANLLRFFICLFNSITIELWNCINQIEISKQQQNIRIDYQKQEQMKKDKILGLHRIFQLLQNLLEIDEKITEGRKITVASLIHASAFPQRCLDLLCSSYQREQALKQIQIPNSVPFGWTIQKEKENLTMINMNNGIQTILEDQQFNQLGLSNQQTSSYSQPIQMKQGEQIDIVADILSTLVKCVCLKDGTFKQSKGTNSPVKYLRVRDNLDLLGIPNDFQIFNTPLLSHSSSQTPSNQEITTFNTTLEKKEYDILPIKLLKDIFSDKIGRNAALRNKMDMFRKYFNEAEDAIQKGNYPKPQKPTGQSSSISFSYSQSQNPIQLSSTTNNIRSSQNQIQQPSIPSQIGNKDIPQNPKVDQSSSLSSSSTMNKYAQFQPQVQPSQVIQQQDSNIQINAIDDQEKNFVEPFPQNGRYKRENKLKMIDDLTNKIWIIKNPVEIQQQVGEFLDIIVTLELEQKQNQSKQQESNSTNILSELLGTIYTRYEQQKSTAQQYAQIILSQLKACALIHPSIANLICGNNQISGFKDRQRLVNKIFDILITLPTRDLRESVAQIIRVAVLKKGEREQIALQTRMNLLEVQQNFWKEAKPTQIIQQSDIYFTYSSPFSLIPDSPVLSPFSQLSSQPVGQNSQSQDQSNEFNEARRVAFLLSCQQFISSQIDSQLAIIQDAQKRKQNVDTIIQANSFDSIFSLFAFLLQHDPQTAFNNRIIQREQQDQVDERERCIFGSEREGKIGVPLFCDIDILQAQIGPLQGIISKLIKLLLLYLQQDQIKQNETKKLSPIEYNSNILAISRLILMITHTNIQMAQTISRELLTNSIPSITKRGVNLTIFDFIISKIQFFFSLSTIDINKDNSAYEDILISQLLQILLICSIANEEIIKQPFIPKLTEIFIQKLIISTTLPSSAHIALLIIKHFISSSFATNNEQILQIIIKSTFEQDNKFKPVLRGFESLSMRIFEEIFIPSPPFIIERESSHGQSNDQNASFIPSLNGTVILFTKPFNTLNLQSNDKYRPQLHININEQIAQQLKPLHLNIIKLILSNEVLLKDVIDLFTKFLVNDNDYSRRTNVDDTILESTFQSFNFFVVSYIEFLNRNPKEKKSNEGLMNKLFKMTLLLTTPKYTLKIRSFSLHLVCRLIKQMKLTTIDTISLLQDLLKSINTFYSSPDIRSQIDTTFSLCNPIQQQQNQSTQGQINDNQEIIIVFGQGFIELSLICLELNSKILQDADIALKQQRRSSEQQDLLKALDDNKEMKNELISHISNTTRLSNIQQSPNIGVIVHRHRVASLLEMILFFIARNSDIPAPFILNNILPDFNNRVMSVFINPQMTKQSYIENIIPLLQHVSIEDNHDRTNQQKLQQINEIVGIIRNSQDSLSLASSQIGYQSVTLFFPAFLFHSLIKQPELIVNQFRNARGVDSNEFAGYYQISMQTLWELILALFKQYQQEDRSEQLKKDCFKYLIGRINIIQSMFGNLQQFAQVIISSNQQKQVQQMNEIILSQIGKSELGQQINDSSNVLLELIRILSNQTSITPIPQSKPKSPDPQPSNQNQYYSSIPKPQSKSPASSPPIQSTSLSQSNSKGKIVIAPPPQPKNINQSQKPQAPSSINVNLNVGNEDIEQVKVYAIYILDKLKKGEVLEQKHFTWIFKLCPDKAAEFNQKNQNEKIILLGGILNAIIQKTGGQ